MPLLGEVRAARAADVGRMATQLQTRLPLGEADLVLEWRFDELLRAGCSELIANLLAASPEVDLHAALDLLGRGCPDEIAARILL